MTGKRDKLICICNCVSEKEILQVLRKGARDLEQVKSLTYAATSCGRCRGETESLIKQFLENKPTDNQTSIIF